MSQRNKAGRRCPRVVACLLYIPIASPLPGRRALSNHKTLNGKQ